MSFEFRDLTISLDPRGCGEQTAGFNLCPTISVITGADAPCTCTIATVNGVDLCGQATAGWGGGIDECSCGVATAGFGLCPDPSKPTGDFCPTASAGFALRGPSSLELLREQLRHSC